MPSLGAMRFSSRRCRRHCRCVVVVAIASVLFRPRDPTYRRKRRDVARCSHIPGGFRNQNPGKKFRRSGEKVKRILRDCLFRCGTTGKARIVSAARLNAVRGSYGGPGKRVFSPRDSGGLVGKRVSRKDARYHGHEYRRRVYTAACELFRFSMNRLLKIPMVGA